jgi:hypothetical protein
MSWAMGGILAFGVFVLIHGIRIRAGESRELLSPLPDELRVPERAVHQHSGRDLADRRGGHNHRLASRRRGCRRGPGADHLGHRDVVGRLAVQAAELHEAEVAQRGRQRRGAEPATGVYGAPSETGARRIYIPPVVYWGLWIATAVIFALVLALNWSPSVLVGLGTGISLLAAHTPKKA